MRKTNNSNLHGLHRGSRYPHPLVHHDGLNLRRMAMDGHIHPYLSLHTHLCLPLCLLKCIGHGTHYKLNTAMKANRTPHETNCRGICTPTSVWTLVSLLSLTLFHTSKHPPPHGNKGALGADCPQKMSVLTPVPPCVFWGLQRYRALGLRFTAGSGGDILPDRTH